MRINPVRSETQLQVSSAFADRTQEIWPEGAALSREARVVQKGYKKTNPC
jgi:hypothetical protein